MTALLRSNRIILRLQRLVDGKEKSPTAVAQGHVCLGLISTQD